MHPWGCDLTLCFEGASPCGPWRPYLWSEGTGPGLEFPHKDYSCTALKALLGECAFGTQCGQQVGRRQLPLGSQPLCSE